MGKSFKVLRNTVRDCTGDPQWIAELGYGVGGWGQKGRLVKCVSALFLVLSTSLEPVPPIHVLYGALLCPNRIPLIKQTMSVAEVSGREGLANP